MVELSLVAVWNTALQPHGLEGRTSLPAEDISTSYKNKAEAQAEQKSHQTYVAFWQFIRPYAA